MLKFTKMHGLGNDFMVIDGVNQSVSLSAEDIQQLSDRHTGVGFDQCLIASASSKPLVDFQYQIFNADGSAVGQCGNGARCLALFLQHHGLNNGNKMVVATQTTQMTLEILGDLVQVDMGRPCFSPKDIPIEALNEQETYQLLMPNGSFQNIYTVNVGNPHAVILVDDIDSAPVESVGAYISQHDFFPEQANVGFMEIVNKQHIKLRVYERGCGETNACGSGAVGAAAVARKFLGLSDEIQVDLLGGSLSVLWPDLSESISLVGPGQFVYDGVLY